MPMVNSSDLPFRLFRRVSIKNTQKAIASANISEQRGIGLPVQPRQRGDPMAGRKRADVAAMGLSAELARRLRTLRDGSHLTLRQLAVKSGFSASTLSLAESGRTVPSWDLVAAFVQSCGQDPARWRQLWEITQAQAAAQAADPAADPPPVSVAEQTADTADADDQQEAAEEAEEAVAPASAGRRRPAVLAGAIVLAAAISAVAIVTLTSAGTGGKPAALAAQSAVIAAKDGTDPYADNCKADEKQLDWQPVRRADHTMFGTIVLMYSPACQAAWGYLDGPNSTAWTTHIIAHRIPGNITAASQFVGNADYGSWGNVLSTRAGCVYVEGYVTDRTGQGPHARTACFQPHPPSAP
jgi:transcriptional regulator with XRE-family HTH domain